MYQCADKLSNYSYAWELLSKANEIDDKTYPPYDASESLQRSLVIMQLFKENNYWLEGLGHSSDVPIFIVGMLRSGSTWLEHVLDAHSNIVGIGEDSIFNGMLPIVIRDILAAIENPSTVEAVAAVIQKHAENILDKMKQRADEVKGPGKGQIRYIVDKMVFNFRNIGLIQLMFPHATIIHIMRDPMDNLFSCYSTRFESFCKLFDKSNPLIQLLRIVYKKLIFFSFLIMI
jgi:hypothetical protein